MSHRGLWLIERQLKHAYRIEDWTRPTNIYLAYFTGAVSEGGVGPEASGNNYSRKLVALGTTNFEFVAPDLVRTKVDIETVAPVGGTWGLLTWAAFFDAASGGNLWVAGALESPIQTVVGAPVVLPAGTGFNHFGRTQA